MEYLIFSLSLSLGVSKNILPKFAKEKFSKIQNVMTVSITTSIVALIIFAFRGIDFSVFSDVRFAFMAALYGLFTFGAQIFYIKAVKDGPVSICSMIYAFCFLVPTIIMAIYFKETISISWIIGIILMMTSVALVVFKGETKQHSSKKYLFYIFTAMISAGSVGIVQKFLGHIYGSDHFDEFVFLSYLFMLLFSVAGKLITSGKEGRISENKQFYLICILIAVSNVVASRMNLYLSLVLPAVVFFPSINGATIFLSTVCSGIFLRERLSIVGWIGILTGIAAIVMIAI